MNTDYENGMNKLIYGDNLTIMQQMPDGFVDLIYLDPPFNSNRSYNMLYKTLTGLPVPEQAEAFCDAWTLSSDDVEKLRTLPAILESYEMDADMIAFWDSWMRALRNTNSKLLSYLFYMMQRLFEMRRILKPNGSIYLHCDPTASHYIKVMMDGVFGQANFRNEIIWCYTSGGKSKRWYARKHDTIFFYSKNDGYYFDVDKVRVPYSAKTLQNYKKGLKGSRNVNLNNIGKVPEDYWNFAVASKSTKQYLGYPTQKPIALIERIIKASCPDNGIVFDPFCGCGTTIYSAHKLNHQWISCDIAILSTQLVKATLEKGLQPLVDSPLKEGVDFELCGYPTSAQGARMLFEDDPKQFEHWAVEWVGGFINQKQSGDRGVDGRIYFETDNNKNLSKMILSVKGGKHINPSMVRDLQGTMHSENSELAGLLLMENPTKGMIEAANKAGQYTYKDTKYDRIQILTVKQMTEEKRLFHLPNKIGHKLDDRQGRFYFN